MIKEQYLFPEFYINKIPKCDNCTDTILEDTGARLASYPPKVILKCPKCFTEYNYTENELQGEWKWRTI